MHWKTIATIADSSGLTEHHDANRLLEQQTCQRGSAVAFLSQSSHSSCHLTAQHLIAFYTKGGISTQYPPYQDAVASHQRLKTMQPLRANKIGGPPGQLTLRRPIWSFVLDSHNS